MKKIKVFGTFGDDELEPGPGDHLAFLLRGDDRFEWDPGDGNDTVLGGSGTDTLEFNGANVAEEFTITDTYYGAELFRNVGQIDMDLRSVERIEVNGLGDHDLIDASGLTKPIQVIADGGDGDDHVVGGYADDTLLGGAGSDRLNGLKGDDLLTGGEGVDRFEFSGSGFGDDTISDWAREDILVLDQVQLTDGSHVTDIGQIDSDGNGLLNDDDAAFEVVDGNLVLSLHDGSVTLTGREFIGANVEIA